MRYERGGHHTPLGTARFDTAQTFTNRNRPGIAPGRPFYRTEGRSYTLPCFYFRQLDKLIFSGESPPTMRVRRIYCRYTIGHRSVSFPGQIN